MSTRFQDWPARLAAFVARRRRMAFAWGSHDCCQFARAAIRELIGKDPAAQLELGNYSTAVGASRVLARLGGIEAIPGACGLIELPIKRAGRGDLVLFAERDGPALGLCLGEKSAFAARKGLAFQPTLSCRRAWRV